MGGGLCRLKRKLRQVMGYIPLPCPVCHVAILFAGSILQRFYPVSCGIFVHFVRVEGAKVGFAAILSAALPCLSVIHAPVVLICPPDPPPVPDS